MQRLQVEAGAQGVELVLGGLAQRADIGGETDDLHYAAAVLDQLHFRVTEVARDVHQGARCRVGGDHRRAAQLRDLLQGLGRHLRHIDDHAQVVEAMHRLLADVRQPAQGIPGIVEERQRPRRVGPGVVAHVAEAEHAHAARRPLVQGVEVIAQRVGVEHADEHRELAFAVQAAEVVGGVGDGHLIGEVTHHRADDLVAGFLLKAGFVDEAGGRAMGRVGTVPDFRPAENRQRRPGQTPATGLDQVELAFTILVDFVAGGAEIHGHGDVAVEREDAFLQLLGLFHHLDRVAGVVPEPVIPGREACTRADRQGQRQADEKSLFRTWFCHCRLSQVRRPGSGAGAFAIWGERVADRKI
ncbi:hypothetical protein D3C71_1235310 [compost metagenome]